jgi:ferredoxin
LKLSIDSRRCQGHGQCEAVAPGLFRLGPDGLAILVLGPEAEVPDAQLRPAEDAIAVCPEMAISWQAKED